VLCKFFNCLIEHQHSGTSGETFLEVERQRLELLSIEDPSNYVPPLPAVSSEAHEKADMLIAYCTVKGITTTRKILGENFMGLTGRSFYLLSRKSKQSYSILQFSFVFSAVFIQVVNKYRTHLLAIFHIVMRQI